MKKILNDPEAYVDEMLDGLVAAHPDTYRIVGDDRRAVARATPGPEGKVGIVSGGGSGHLPVFTGYVGTGLLDACAIGDVFASPTADQMADAIRAADRGAGVLRLYGNYGGRRDEFRHGGRSGRDGGYRNRHRPAGRRCRQRPAGRGRETRGVAGMVYAFKIAGAAAEAGQSLADVTRIAQATADACRSIGAALSPCIVPRRANPPSASARTRWRWAWASMANPASGATN